MFKRAVVFVFAAVLLVSSIAGAADTAVITAALRDGKTIQTELASGPGVDVIVEFRDPPLFAKLGVSAAATTAVRASRAAALEGRFTQLASDLRAIEALGAKQAQSADRSSSLITHTFERVFAGASVTASPRTAAALANLSYVAAVYPDRTLQALERERSADATLAESVAKIEADKVWTQFGTRGAGVVVAVIDTGIDYKHPAFGGAFGPGNRVIGGWDFVNKDADPMDDVGHGTHVAGIIGGNGGGITGVAPEVSFLAYKVLAQNGSGTSSDVISGLERATDPNQDRDPADHADVVNMSLGGAGSADDPAVKAVQTATAAGVLVVVAAGNNGGFYTVSSPAIAPAALAVGATDVADALAYFSSCGPEEASLAIKPEVVAPGVSISSAAMGGGLVAKSGTSMATPHVAGVAALVKAVHRAWTPAEIKSSIVSSAETLPIDVMAQGGGRVDALRAAGTEVVTEPAALGLGRAVTDANLWTGQGDVRLTNRGATAVTLTAGATGATDAIAAVVEPDSMTLQPGETKSVTLKVTVDHSLLPYPKQGSLALSGQVVFSTAGAQLHVPWAFVKAARLTITYDNDDLLSATVATKRDSGARTVNRFGQRRLEVYEPPGDYDVLLYVYALNGSSTETHALMAPRRTIAGDDTLAFSSTSPLTSVVYASRAPDGRLLADIGRTPGQCINDFAITYPDDSQLLFSGMASPRGDGGAYRFLVSAVPAGLSLTGSQVCWDDSSSVYIAQFGEIDTSSPYVEPAVTGDSWQKVPIGVVAPAGLENQSVIFGGAWLIAHGPLIVPLPKSAVFPLTGSAWRGTLFISEEQHSRMVKMASLQVTTGTGSSASTVVQARAIRHTSDGIVLSPYRTVGAATFVGRTGDPLIFGDGLAHPEAFLYADDGALMSSISWLGSLGETRPLEAKSAALLVRDNSGAVIAEGAQTPNIKLERDGSYTLEVKQQQTVAGFASETQLRTRVDTTAADSAAPTLTCLRVIDADGTPVSVLSGTGRGLLRIAALDLVLDKATHKRTYALVVRDKTTIQWRRHGSGAWQTLPFAVEAQEVVNSTEEFDALGHAPAGTVFGCDLSPVTVAVRGPVDVQFHVEDVSGNSLDYVISPAFVVGEGRRRAVAH